MRNPHWSPDVVALGDRVAALRLAQADELRRYLDEVHGLRADVGVAVGPEQFDTPSPPDMPEPAVLGVRLDGHDALRKIAVIRAVRELTGAALLEARRLVENAPTMLFTALPRAEAERVCDVLEEAGAVVSLV